MIFQFCTTIIVSLFEVGSAAMFSVITINTFFKVHECDLMLIDA